jgi:hypothetical protein
VTAARHRLSRRHCQSVAAVADIATTWKADFGGVLAERVGFEPTRAALFASPSSPCNRGGAVCSRSSTVTLESKSPSLSADTFAGNPQ